MIIGMGNTLDIYAQIGLIMLVGMASKNMNVRFWHKADVQGINVYLQDT
jgi:multidrug efflux pump subunit AcrB